MNNLSSYVLWVNWCKNKSFWQRFICTVNPPWDNFGCQTKLSMIAMIVRQNLQLSNGNIIVGYVGRFFVQNAVVFSYLEDISMSLVLSEFVTPVTKILKKILHKCCQVFFLLLITESHLELVSKELNHLAAILHVYAGGLNFMK